MYEPSKSDKRLAIFIYIASSIAMAIVMGIGIAIPFRNPELTQTQLVIEYWYLWLSLMFMLFSVIFLNYRLIVYQGKKEDLYHFNKRYPKVHEEWKTKK